MEEIKSIYKKCDCDIEAWEEIIVQNDDNYENRTVIYYHCTDCDYDFAVIDFITDEVLYLEKKYFK